MGKLTGGGDGGGDRGRDKISPTIFNVVVDSVVRLWNSLAAGGAGRKDGWGREVLHHPVFLRISQLGCINGPGLVAGRV